MKKNIVGMENAGFKIIEAEYIDFESGYCLGWQYSQYVTWWFKVSRGNDVSFYTGHYHPIDFEASARCKYAAYADYHQRLMTSYGNMAKYGV